MSPLSLFLVEVGLCVVASTLFAGLLTRRLRRVLIDACGTVERARFWAIYSNAMIFIAPLLAVLVFGKSGSARAPTLAFYKAALGSALFGILVSLSAIGVQLARLLPRRVDDEAAP